MDWLLLCLSIKIGMSSVQIFCCILQIFPKPASYNYNYAWQVLANKRLGGYNTHIFLNKLNPQEKSPRRSYTKQLLSPFCPSQLYQTLVNHKTFKVHPSNLASLCLCILAHWLINVC